MSVYDYNATQSELYVGECKHKLDEMMSDQLEEAKNTIKCSTDLTGIYGNLLAEVDAIIIRQNACLDKKQFYAFKVNKTTG
jgi:hypothetical protein